MLVPRERQGDGSVNFSLHCPYCLRRRIRFAATRFGRGNIKIICQNKESLCDSLRAGARKRQLASSSAHQSHPRGAFLCHRERSYIGCRHPATPLNFYFQEPESAFLCKISFNLIQCVLFIVTVCGNSDFFTCNKAQCHHAHDALGIHPCNA